MRRLLPFLAVLICGAVLGATRATEPYDYQLLDAQFRLLRSWFPRPAAR